MALLKQCNICKNKGFRLKLNDGLCTDCLIEFENLERNYIEILNKISLPTSNQNSLLSQLKIIVSNMPKFETKENSIKLLNYKTQLSLLENTLNISNNLYSNSINTTREENSTESINLIQSEEPNNKTSESSKIINLEKLSQPTDVKLESITRKDKPIISDNSIALKTELNSPIIIEDSNNVESIKNEKEESITDKNENIENSKNPVESLNKTKLLNNLYHKTAAIIGLLNDNSISDNIFAENLFLLKNEIFPVLKEHYIEKVSDENLIDFIEKKENILSIRTNQKKEELFDFFNYIAFSIQTTGIKPNLSDIIEISALKIKYGKVVDKFYTLVNPNKSIKVLIEQRTGISTDAVKNAPQIYIALENFLTFSENLKLISHNENFTTSFLNFNSNKINGDEIKNKTGCTMKLYRIRYKSYYGIPTENFDILSCAKDLLPEKDFNELTNLDSIAKASALATFKLYEIIKFKYK